MLPRVFWQTCEEISQSTCSWGVCRLPRFPWALNDLWTCPGPWPPFFAVIRATKPICCLWGVGPQASLAKHEAFQRKRWLSQPDPAKRIWEVQATSKTQLESLSAQGSLPGPNHPSSASTPADGSHSVCILHELLLPAEEAEGPPARRDS